jgi:hypothetical protein
LTHSREWAKWFLIGDFSRERITATVNEPKEKRELVDDLPG